MIAQVCLRTRLKMCQLFVALPTGPRPSLASWNRVQMSIFIFIFISISIPVAIFIWVQFRFDARLSPDSLS